MCTSVQEGLGAVIRGDLTNFFHFNPDFDLPP